MRVMHVNLNFNVSSLYKHFGNHLIGNRCNISMYFPTLKDFKQVNELSYLVTSPILNKYDRFLFNYRNKKVLEDIEKKYDLNKVDILHAHSLFSNGNVAYSIKKKFNIPYIVAVRNTDINLFFKKLFYMRKKGIEILKNAEKIIFLSKPYKELLLEKYVPNNLRKSIEEKIEIIPNGVDSFWLDNIYERKLGPNKNKLKVLSVGVINKNKNALTTAKACQNLINKLGLDVEFKVIGKIQDKRYFSKLSEFKFVKHVAYQSKEELIKEYRNTDIFVMPSIKETFGLVYVEALSQGVPVLYSKGQGFDKQFEDGVIGFSIDSNDHEDIETKIKHILQKYNQLSSNCIKHVDKYSWDRISKDYIKIYEEVVKSLISI